MWIAGKNQTIKRDGAYVDVTPGDPIPEAAFWVNRTPWINRGFIKQGPEPVSVEIDMGLNISKPGTGTNMEKKDNVVIVSL